MVVAAKIGRSEDRRLSMGSRDELSSGCVISRNALWCWITNISARRILESLGLDASYDSSATYWVSWDGSVESLYESGQDESVAVNHSSTGWKF